MRSVIASLLLLVFNPALQAQILPANASTVNYTLVPFSVQSGTGNDSCIFEIAAGHYETIASFNKNITIRKAGITKGTLVQLPAFNSEYTWCRVDKAHLRAEKKELHYFKTGYSKFIDTNYYRTTIIKAAEPATQPIYLFNDYLRTLTTLEGVAVWYLPDIPGVVDDNTLVRDLKPTYDGTLTFFTNEDAYEIDYNGNILWKAPNDGRISGSVKENYHHEFIKMPNGHYMLSGTVSVEKLIPASLHTLPENQSAKGKLMVQYETLIEYDSNGSIVWSWKGSEHIPDELVFSKTGKDGTINTSMHLNSFYFNEKESCIYIGFRDISSILKIQYPSGKIINTYTGTPAAKPQLFKSQHCCRTDDNGNIYMYSNNNPGKNERTEHDEKTCISSIVILKEEQGKPEKTWEFKCDIDKNALPCTNSGGSVYLLKTGDILVSMGSVNRNFIINKNKNLLWNAITEKKEGDGRWVPTGTYRISCIETYKQLEKLAFHYK
jgi:hypothetical protein